MATWPFSGQDNYQLIDFYRKRKRACKTKADRPNNLKTDAEDDSNGNNDLGKELELNSRIFVNSSYSKKKRKKKIEEMTLPECGSADHYERLNVIDRGAYGVVYRARDTRTGEIVAMKDGLSLTEIGILTSLPRHHRIVELKEVAVDGTNNGGGVYVVMEYAEYDLHRYMKVKDALTLTEIKSLMKQLLEGVDFLHRNMVMHRDLKPSNILVSSDGEVKICDFGQSRRFKLAESASYSSHVGSLQYRAPELLLGARAYSSEVDMWSVGCIMGELLSFCGRQTRSGQLETIYGILGSVEDHKFCGDLVIKEDGFDLLSRLLSCDPTKRITAEDALNHVWFHDLAS